MRKAVARIALRKAPGPDGVSSTAARRIGTEASRWLTYVFNVCLKKGYWPESWKTGRLVLIPKVKSPPESTDKAYRPLSIISCLAKILEHIMKDKLLAALEKCDLAPNQFGFRRGRSTIDAMQVVMSHCQKARRGRRHCLLTMLDVKNAFNSLKWSSVVKCMKDRGFPTGLVNLIADYLDNRCGYRRGQLLAHSS